MTHIEKLLDEYFLIRMMDAAVPCTRDEGNTHATGKVSLAAKSPPGRLENLLRQDGNVPEFKSAEPYFSEHLPSLHSTFPKFPFHFKNGAMRLSIQSSPMTI